MSQVRAFAERIERVHAERDELAADVRDLYAEAKDKGLDVKALKAVIAYRRKLHKDRDGVEALEAKVQEYLAEIESGINVATRVRARAARPEQSNPQSEAVPSASPAAVPEPHPPRTTGTVATHSRGGLPPTETVPRLADTAVLDEGALTPRGEGIGHPTGPLKASDLDGIPDFLRRSKVEALA